MISITVLQNFFNLMLEIKFDPGEGLNLYINGQSEHIYVDYANRVSALRRANKRFDADLEQAASLYPNEKKGAFLWCYTAAFLRSENVTDLIRLYFLLELIKSVKQTERAYQLLLHYNIPKDAYVELTELGFYPMKSLGYYKSLAREWIKVGYHAFKAVQKNLSSFLASKNTSLKGNLLDVNQSPTNNRLDSLENYNFYKPYRVFSGQEHKIEGFEEKDIVVFRNENNFWDGLIILFQALHLTIHVEKQQYRLPMVYKNHLKKRDIFRLWSLLLYERGSHKYFSKSTIQKVVHVSTLTKPEYRILWAKAKEFKIKIILVSSRTLKSLSSSERLIEADIKGYSKTVLPDHIIVRNQFSKDVFKGLPFYETIQLGGRFKLQPIEHKPQLKDEKVLYLVLTHIKSCSDYLLAEVSKINYKAIGIDTVIFRSHPTVKYSIQEIQNFFIEYKIINHTGESMATCPYKNIIMISGPTTGALELMREGISLFWLPYIWKDGILFDDIMRKYGTICHNLKRQLKIVKHKNVLMETNCFVENKKIISEQIESILKANE